MKVLVMFQEIPETVRLILVDMTPSEFQELLPAHDEFIGCYDGQYDAVTTALCKANYAFAHADKDTMDSSDVDWMQEEGVDPNWYDRFEGRMVELTNAHTATKIDAFLNTGYVG